MLWGRLGSTFLVSAVALSFGCQQDECFDDDDCERGWECTNIGVCRELSSGRIPPPTTNRFDYGVAGPRDGGTATNTDTGTGVPNDTGTMQGNRDAGVGDTGAVDTGLPVGTFDPGHLYLTGPWSGGGGLGIINVTDTSAEPIVGLPSGLSLDRATIRGSTSHFVYTTRAEMYLMRPDVLDGNQIPRNVGANDFRLPASACTGNAPLWNVFASPTSGGLIYECLRIGYFDLGGVPVDFQGWRILTLGYGDLALVDQGQSSTTTALIDRNGTVTRIRGLPPRAGWNAQRAHPTGFYFATASELWNVDMTGQATASGTYPGSPMGTLHFGNYGLDQQGDLYSTGGECIACAPQFVIRKSVAGRSEVVYDHSMNATILVTDRARDTAFISAP